MVFGYTVSEKNVVDQDTFGRKWFLRKIKGDLTLVGKFSGYES